MKGFSFRFREFQGNQVKKTKLTLAGLRKLSLKVSEYEKLLDDLEAFNKKSESLRKELIEVFSGVIDVVFK